MCAEKLTDATQNQKLKTEKKITKNKNGYAQKKRYRTRNREVSPEGGKGSRGWKGFVGTGRFESEEVMDGESGESTGEDEVADVGRDESELEWLVRGCRRVVRGLGQTD